VAGDKLAISKRRDEKIDGGHTLGFQRIAQRFSSPMHSAIHHASFFVSDSSCQSPLSGYGRNMVKNLESSTTSGDLGRLTMAGLDKDARQDLGGVAAAEKE